MNLVITGTLAYDYIMDFSGKFADRIMPDKIHKISLSFLVDRLNKQFGGTAGNVAYALKLLGTDGQILSCAGNDFSLYKTHLEKYGISQKYISVHQDEPMGSYFVVSDTEHNQIGAFYTGAIKYAPQLKIPSALTIADLVLIGPTEPAAMKKYIVECQTQKIPYMYDPAFQIANFTAEELSLALVKARIFIANDYEVALVEKKLGVTHEKLLEICPIVVTTLGSQGSVIEISNLKSQISNKNKKIKILPATKTQIIDTTGAGDAYRGGFLAGFARGFDLETCGKMGSIAASYCIEHYGTQKHEFAKEAFCKRYQENFSTSLTL